jgi:type VI secretion system protein ImpA
MATVEPIPPVIDFEALLKPISEENPSGESMQYSGLYDEIREARRSDDPTLAQGQWQSELKSADYRQVINLVTSALSNQTKDLQIGVWLCEALTGVHGFAGFRDGLKLLCQLEELFWDTLYPEIDEGDMEGRANSIDWMSREISIMLKKIPISGGEGFTFLDWDESTRFDIPEDLDSLSYDDQERFKALRTQAETENRKTGDRWRKAKAATNRAFCETLHLTLEECIKALNELDRVNEEKFSRNQVPGVNDLKKILSDITSQVTKLLEEKREQEPDPDDFAETITEEGEDGELIVKKGPAVATGAIQNRQDALKRLADVAEYFRKNEPHSPVAYLVQRAVKWGNMSLEIWLQDVIKDDTVIFQIRQTLGFNTGENSES